MSDFERFRNEQLQDSEFLEIFLDRLPVSDISKVIVGYRKEKDISQKELAKLTGIHQTDISRLEHCEGNPSLKTINKLAKGLGMAVRIQLVPIESILNELEE